MAEIKMQIFIFSLDDVEFIAKTASKQNWLGELFFSSR